MLGEGWDRGSFIPWLIRIPCAHVNGNIEKITFLVTFSAVADVNNRLEDIKLY